MRLKFPGGGGVHSVAKEIYLFECRCEDFRQADVRTDDVITVFHVWSLGLVLGFEKTGVLRIMLIG